MEKRQRLAEIVNRLTALEPTDCIKNMHSNLVHKFKEVEHAFPEKERMKVEVLDAFHVVSLAAKKRTVRFYVHKKHILILGDNGSCDIRSMGDKKYTAGFLSKNIMFACHSLTPIFLKQGKNGKDVWQSN